MEMNLTKRAFLRHLGIGGLAAASGQVFGDEFVVNHFFHRFFGDYVNHIKFVRGSETVKEVQERNSCFKR